MYRVTNLIGYLGLAAGICLIIYSVHAFITHTNDSNTLIYLASGCGGFSSSGALLMYNGKR